MTRSNPLSLPQAPLWRSDGLDDVEALMASLATGSRLDRLGPIVREHLETGGKRLRARLALAAAEMLGLPRSAGVAWAAACELLHNATLVHDDVQDGDRVRRGGPTVWVRHGVGQAINAGDVMLMLPFRALEHVAAPDDIRWRLAAALARGAETVVRGQASEMSLLGARRLGWSHYGDAVRGKTAALFQLPIEGAALLAGWSSEGAAALAASAADLGLAFQIQDDILDLYGDKGRGTRGSDLEEGKVSALVVAHLELCPDQTDALVALLEAPRDETRRADVEAAIGLFAEGGALASTWRRLDAIRDELSCAPALDAAPRLRELLQGLFALAMSPIEQVRP